MPRKPRCRWIDSYPDHWGFSPDEDSDKEPVVMSLDEFETIRLLDREGLTQEQCAERMGIARTTVTAIYESARRKVADALVDGKRLLIRGGNYQLNDQGTENIMQKGSDTMRIAVTYENGRIFQHFGHTEQFKVYEVEDGKVVSSEIVGSDGQGHGALAELLSLKGIDVLICGGIGGGAVTALGDLGIELCAGADGDADEAVEAYLRGELTNSGANCDHHGEGHSCGEHECGNGGCHSEKHGKNAGKTCRTHYRGTFNDGTQFDSSYDRGEPLEFVCGAGMMIKGFDDAVANMDVGEVVDIHLTPGEAYGEVDPNAFFTVELAKMPGSEGLSVGDRVYLQNVYGQSFPVKVTAKDDESITFDANHEMAGKELNFRIELVEVK